MDSVTINVQIVKLMKMTVLAVWELIDLPLFLLVLVIMDILILELLIVLSVNINVLPVKLLLVTV